MCVCVCVCACLFLEPNPRNNGRSELARLHVVKNWETRVDGLDANYPSCNLSELWMCLEMLFCMSVIFECPRVVTFTAWNGRFVLPVQKTLRERGVHWPVQWDQFRSERDAEQGWLRACLHCVCVCVCVCVLPVEIQTFLPPQISWCEPFTLWNEKQIQIFVQAPSFAVTSESKSVSLSPCCFPPGLKYFLFECVWWKVFSAQPQRAGVLRGRQLCVRRGHWNTYRMHDGREQSTLT